MVSNTSTEIKDYLHIIRKRMISITGKRLDDIEKLHPRVIFKENSNQLEDGSWVQSVPCNYPIASTGKNVICLVGSRELSYQHGEVLTKIQVKLYGLPAE